MLESFIFFLFYVLLSFPILFSCFLFFPFFYITTLLRYPLLPFPLRICFSLYGVSAFFCSLIFILFVKSQVSCWFIFVSCCYVQSSRYRQVVLLCRGKINTSSICRLVPLLICWRKFKYSIILISCVVCGKIFFLDFARTQTVFFFVHVHVVFVFILSHAVFFRLHNPLSNLSFICIIEY